ncbi:glycosyltransferase family 32 protein [Heyndrickxia coagulans]|uniref:glycosyltransferase family 32 protein n=1 Tax=Heyndrickxia coagulans TaxID=1398 RepID=UPI0002FB2D8D|nr:glycosyltransferase [Heyndrickxia coagulans]
MSIPKIIHYCWFGKEPKSELIRKCIRSWSVLEGYKIIEWNESNFNIESNPYVKEAYEKGKFAFVSDYVRLKVLYEFGGIYLDTDVEIKKNFNGFLENRLFMGFMFNCLLGTAVIGTEKKHPVIFDLLCLYSNMELKAVPNNNTFTEYFINNFSEFKLNNTLQFLDKGVVIYPKEYFERPTYNRKLGYSIHHYTASWKNQQKKKKYLKVVLKSILGDVLFSKLMHSIHVRKNSFYKLSLKQK